MHLTSFVYDSIDSTNEEAKRLLLSGAILQASLGSPAYVLANAQTHGKGTQGRHWVSPEGAGLYLTIVHTALSEQPLVLTDIYTQAAGLACLQVLDELLGLRIELKPVNDLYTRCPRTGRYKKLGGILVESFLQENILKAVMTGVGINILSAERSLKPELNQHPDIVPISLEDVLDRPKLQQIQEPQNRREFIETLVYAIDDAFQTIARGEQQLILEKYQAACISNDV